MTRHKNVAPDWQARDPEHARERRQYAHPVPSRALITQDIEADEAGLSRDALVASYELESEASIEALDHRVRAMLRDGQLAENAAGRLTLASGEDRIRGHIQAHAKGFGFLIPDETSADDVFLSPPEMRTLMHGDRADVALKSAGPGRREGRLVQILERANDTVVGRLIHERGSWRVVPHRTALTQPIVVADGDLHGATNDSVVSVRITRPPDKRHDPTGEVVEIIGEHMSPGMEIELALRAHDIPHEFPEPVVAAADALGDRVKGSDAGDRVDLRDLPLVTIDGADAKDFDDAVHAKATRGGWKLRVAIADVSHYVHPGAPLDYEAQERGTSVYFPEHVVPMLPETLSNGLCSLVPDQDRLALVCELTIDRDGHTRSSRFYNAVIRSHARLTYEQVADWLAHPDHRPDRYEALGKPLADLHALYHALQGARAERGAIAFETKATRFVFDDTQKIEKIVPTERNVAHKIIEECMITANVAAAGFLTRRKLPTLYRVHETPPADALAELREFLSERGLSLPSRDEPTAADFDRVLAAARERNDAELIQTVMLQSLSRAFYGPGNTGHFGLALDQYAHFTSPIRRYPDLLVHRGIKHLLAGGRARDFVYDPPAMEALGEHCSTTEQRADYATREVEDWLKCEYMSDAIGDVFAGTVSGVTAFGLFVELDDIHVSGLVHISNLGADYFVFDERSRELRGERSGRRYCLADRMQVRVMQVDLDERKIDLEPTESETGGKRRGGRRSPKSRKGKQ